MESPLYLLDLFYSGARANGAGALRLRAPGGDLPKWTILPPTDASLELLELAALVCGGAVFLPRLGQPLGRWCGGETPLRIEALVLPHSPRDIRYNTPPRRGLAVELTPNGEVRPLRRSGCPHLPAGVGLSHPTLPTANERWFLLAYGPRHRLHRGTDRFDFSDPFFRVDRFRPLFDPSARLTDPVEFLSRIHLKGCRLGRHPPRRTLARLAGALSDHMGLDTRGWLDRDYDFEAFWEGLGPGERRQVAPILDAARHAVDASAFRPEPLDIPCLVLWDRPDEAWGAEGLTAWASMVHGVFPAAQIIARVHGGGAGWLPAPLARERLPVPPPDEGPRAPRRRRTSSKVPPGAVVLAQVDGTLPNLALMKLARSCREQGREVILTRGGETVERASAAYASVVFTSGTAARRLEKLRQWYGPDLVEGGSGVDLALRLPPEVESLPPDYSLYPELGDRALGFLTRGCPFDCPFCVVPRKEGRPRQVSDLDALLQGRKKLILLDDNILAHPGANALLEEMVRRDIRVNFNQTLDLRLVTPERARLLRRVRCSNVRFTRPVIHFSLNDARNLELVRDRYELLGFTAGDNVEFVCMYGYDTTLEEDVERFRFLRSLPGAYVFVQEYRPVGDMPRPEVPDFFGPDPDRLIRELVSICFPQNMKSMEKYYRWLSRRYAQRFGRLNGDLVDTIFRYNRRAEKGLYLATLAHTLDPREAPGLRA